MDMANKLEVKILSTRLTQLANDGVVVRTKVFQLFLRHFMDSPRMTNFQKGNAGYNTIG